MNKDFLPYPLALRLKAIGFNQPCISFYSKGGKHNFDVQNPCTNIGSWSDQEHYCSAPTFSHAFRWFREEHELDSFCRQTALNGRSYWKINKIESDDRIKGYSNFTNSYREAELACLDKLIEIVEQKKNKDGR